MEGEWKREKDWRRGCVTTCWVKDSDRQADVALARGLKREREGKAKGTKKAARLFILAVGVPVEIVVGWQQ